MITISAFRWVPPFAQGQVRDLRVRWALEEAGLPYRTRLLEQGDQDKPDYRALQPFGQVPILEEDGRVLFESGAIVLHIGERSETLLPKDPAARARATQWLIAALNSIEPHIMNVAVLGLFYADQEWAKLRRPSAVEFARHRLSCLAKALGDKPHLDGERFTAGDLMMTTVLRILPELGRAASGGLRRALHGPAGFQARARCAAERLPRRRVARAAARTRRALARAAGGVEDAGTDRECCEPDRPRPLRRRCTHRTPARPRTPASSPSPRWCAPAPCSRRSRRPRTP